MPSTFDINVTPTSFVFSVRCSGKKIHPQRAGLDIDGKEPELRPRLLAEELPRDQVRVVLHLGEEDLVAFVDVLFRPREPNEVDRLGRATGEDDRTRAGSADVTTAGIARTLVRLGCDLAELVDAAMDVRVLGFVEVDDPVDDLTRFLRGGGRVEIDQRLPVWLVSKIGKSLRTTSTLSGKLTLLIARPWLLLGGDLGELLFRQAELLGHPA